MGAVTVADGSNEFTVSTVDPGATGGLDEKEADDRLRRLSAELRELQYLMFAAKSNAMLVILQGMDAAGKDVIISDVFTAANPESIHVYAFKPTEEDEAHHFLWRASQIAPAKGEITILDRSYYEQLIVGQVSGELESDEFKRKTEHVRAFERLLIDHGTIVVKAFLHVSPDEQRQRLVSRQENPETAWDISPRDWEARNDWDAYMAAYETVVQATATEAAPWYVVPSDHQWFNTLAVAEAIVERLRQYRSKWIEDRDRTGAEKASEARAAQAAVNDKR